MSLRQIKINKTKPEILLKKKIYAQTHKSQLKLRRLDYVNKNREIILKKQKAYYIKIKKELMEYLGGIKCSKCGFTDIRALQFDHIKGNGKQDRLIHKSHTTLALYYYKKPELAKQEIQVLCANCNWIKRFENYEHKGSKV